MADSRKVKDAIVVGCCALNKKHNPSLRRHPSKIRRAEDKKARDEARREEGR